MNDHQRRAIISRYVSAVRAVGDAVVDERKLRVALQSGTVDLWAASELRESSLWRDPTLFAQLKALVDDAARPALRQRTLAMLLRSVAAWTRSLLHAIPTRGSKPLDCDVVFVEYWPPSAQVAAGSETAWSSPYFRDLPNRLRQSGVSVGFVHLHADGPVTKTPRHVEQSVSRLSESGTPHRLVSDYLSFTTWRRALNAWLRIIRRAPATAGVEAAICHQRDANRLWSWWNAKYSRSVFGSHAVRTCVLSEMFQNMVKTNPGPRLWVVAFEGQSWESCLTRQFELNGAKWLPYVHTMMRPWDLRAHTFLAETPPAHLAVHGPHDVDELSGYETKILDVEALRYQQLGRANTRTASASALSAESRTWVVVGGAECEVSAGELRELQDAMTRSGVRRRLIAKPHPQCTGQFDGIVGVDTSTSHSLSELLAGADAAIVVGSAAPLDSYLAGVPTCSFTDESGFAMTPLDEDDFFHCAASGDDAVAWLTAAEQRHNAEPPVPRYFIIDESLPRWLKLIAEMLRN